MKPVKGPIYYNDRKAPRMKKGEFSKRVITRQLYARFIEEFPEYKEVTWIEFYNTWCQIAERIRYHAIHNPLGVKLGSYMGELKFQYLPYQFEGANHSLSESEGEKKKNMNVESRGKTPTIKWERRWAVKFNKMLQFYAFSETRELNRVAHAYMKDQNTQKIRVSRNTLGGVSVWRKKIKDYDQKTDN